jgi:hypothetical protein
MATESDPAVTRVTVILNTPDDWFTWLFIRRDVANRHGLWQYINPDVAKELLPELTEAAEPQLIDYKAGAIRLSDLTADDRESCPWECDRWERRRSEYRTQKKALADLNTDISKTIAVRHIYLIRITRHPMTDWSLSRRSFAQQTRLAAVSSLTSTTPSRLLHELRRRSNNGCPTRYTSQLRANRSSCLKQKAIGLRKTS